MKAYLEDLYETYLRILRLFRQNGVIILINLRSKWHGHADVSHADIRD